MEKDDEVKGSEGSNYTTEFRQYDPRIGRWFSIDPKFQKYPYSSPYSSFLNNPLIFKDKGGDTTYYFSEEGVLLEIAKLDEKGIKVMVTMQLPKTLCAHCFGPREVSLHDYNFDKSRITSLTVGEKSIYFITDNNIAWFLDYAGIHYDYDYMSPILSEFWLACNSFGYFDYNGSYLWEAFNVYNASEADGKKELFLIDGTLYNMNDAGQYLWGVTAAKLGVAEPIARLGAHLNNFVTDRSGGALFDSDADQKAISNGMAKGISFGWSHNKPKPVIEKPSFIPDDFTLISRSRKQQK